MKQFKITMEDGAYMIGELYEDIAPETVANFEKLIKVPQVIKTIEML